MVHPTPFPVRLVLYPREYLTPSPVFTLGRLAEPPPLRRCFRQHNELSVVDTGFAVKPPDGTTLPKFVSVYYEVSAEPFTARQCFYQHFLPDPDAPPLYVVCQRQEVLVYHPLADLHREFS